MRIAIFGLGSIGRRHMQNLIEMGETDLFVYDPILGGGEDITPCPVQITNSLGMIWRWQPEAVLICAPPIEHFSLAMQALDHDAHCFIEKPVTSTAKQAELLKARAAESPNLKIAVGYQLRWQLQDVGLRNISIVSKQDMTLWPSRYEKDVLLEFSHEIDAATFINGPVMSVAAVENSKGLLLHLGHHLFYSAIHVHAYSAEYAREIYAGDDERERVWTFSKEANDLCYKYELADFLTACRHPNIWPIRLCSLAQAAHVIKIVDACKQSIKNFEVVQL